MKSIGWLYAVAGVILAVVFLNTGWILGNIAGRKSAAAICEKDLDAVRGTSRSISDLAAGEIFTVEAVTDRGEKGGLAIVLTPEAAAFLVSGLPAAAKPGDRFTKTNGGGVVMIK